MMLIYDIDPILRHRQQCTLPIAILPFSSNGKRSRQQVHILLGPIIQDLEQLERGFRVHTPLISLGAAMIGRDGAHLRGHAVGRTDLVRRHLITLSCDFISRRTVPQQRETPWQGQTYWIILATRPSLPAEYIFRNASVKMTDPNAITFYHYLPSGDYVFDGPEGNSDEATGEVAIKTLHL
ncbi:hypothetical protein DM01DRAFT_139671 [Hesseltinella vesiculosa]|uniref:Uncharacterized protein n=1 Tax=Hesseltinella vesiculosa TaxID=101127 RepID=A0A1X2GEF6_9FUNG|nr:hypothetical protein DM01DRAFT_139671 [Hesseltinella vesiculosa]